MLLRIARWKQLSRKKMTTKQRKKNLRNQRKMLLRRVWRKMTANKRERVLRIRKRSREGKRMTQSIQKRMTRKQKRQSLQRYLECGAGRESRSWKPYLQGWVVLTHCGLVIISDVIWWHRSGSALAQVMACCLMAPNHYLNQCLFIIGKVQWHSSEGNFHKRYQSYPSKIFQSLRGQWVKHIYLTAIGKHFYCYRSALVHCIKNWV